jgi:hypothetical protein
MKFNNLNILSLLPKQEQSFVYDEASSEVIFKEIFIKVALDDFESFKKLCDLPLSWLDEFKLNHVYSLQSNSDSYDLSDDGQWYANFFNAAAAYFPDKYCNYILERILPLISKDEKTKNSFARQCEFVCTVLLVNSKTATLNILMENELINNEIIIKKVFENDKELTTITVDIMKNESLQDYILETATENHSQSIFSLMLRNKRSYWDSDFNSAILNIDNAYRYMPNKKQQVTENILSVMNNHKNYDGLREKWPEVLLHLLVEGHIEIHTNYCSRTGKIINVHDAIDVFDKIINTIEKHYHLKKDFIEQVYSLRMEKLNKSLKAADDTKKIISKI